MIWACSGPKPSDERQRAGAVDAGAPLQGQMDDFRTQHGHDWPAVFDGSQRHGHPSVFHDLVRCFQGLGQFGVNGELVGGDIHGLLCVTIQSAVGVLVGACESKMIGVRKIIQQNGYAVSRFRVHLASCCERQIGYVASASIKG